MTAVDRAGLNQRVATRGRRIGNPRPYADRRDVRALAAIVLSYALLGFVPALVTRIEKGRAYQRAIDAEYLTNSARVEMLGYGFGALLAVICAYVVITRLRRLTESSLAVVVAFAIVAATGAYYGGFEHVPVPAVLTNLAVALAVCTLRVDVSALAVFAHVGAAIACASILFGLVDDRAWRAGTVGTDVETKAIIGSGILAGPYPSSNNLGIGLAMALPFVALVRSRRIAIAEAAAISLGLILTASRASILAAIAAVAAALLLRLVRGASERQKVYVIGMLVLGAFALALPWAVNDPRAFTSRGAIWLASREFLEQSPLNGAGFAAYAHGGEVAWIGFRIHGSHNALMHYWVVGGVLAGAAVAALLILVAMRCGQLLRESLVLPAFAVILFVLAAVEEPLRPDTIIGPCWIAIPLTAYLCSRLPHKVGLEAAGTDSTSEAVGATWDASADGRTSRRAD